MTRRLFFRLFITLMAIALPTFLIEPKGAIFKPGDIFINIIIGFLIFRTLIILIMFWSIRHPVIIYSDHIRVSFAWAFKYPFAHIIRREAHDKTGELSLVIKHPRVEKPYQLKLPWKLIAESEAEVAAKIDALIFDQKRFE